MLFFLFVTTYYVEEEAGKTIGQGRAKMGRKRTRSIVPDGAEGDREREYEKKMIRRKKKKT